MQAASLQYKLIKKIKDDRFEEDNIHQYDLLINIGIRDLQIGIVDSLDNRLLFLEDYVFPALSSVDELIAILSGLVDSHALLQANFWKQIKISLKNNKFAQVPRVLFVPEAGEEYLQYNAYLDDEDVIESIYNARIDAYTVFGIPGKLKQWIDKLYPNNAPIYMHQSAALIEGISQYATSHPGSNPLYIYVDRFKLHVIAFESGKLLYYNQFIIKQFSDYIKYIMLVMKSLGIDQNKSQVMLWGYIGRNSPHYHEFYKYISNVIFGTRPDFLKFGFIFDEVQDHHFLDLYNMHLLNTTTPTRS